MDIQSLAALSDSDLLARAKRLAHNECHATAALIAHLAEIETRKLYLGEACSSLFSYCIRVLHLSEPAAYNRIQAARAARRFPAVLASLEQGSVHLAAVRLLAPVLTPENHCEMLAVAAHKSKREVEELVARLRPQPDVPSGMRKLPARNAPAAAGLFESAGNPPPGMQEARIAGPEKGWKSEVEGEADARAEAGAQAGPQADAQMDAQTATVATAATAAAAQPVSARAAAVCAAPALNSVPQRGVVVPLGAERYKVQFTASTATRDKLRRAQELLRHRVPSGDVGQVIDLALDLLVRDLEKQKFAATSRPRRSESSAERARSSSAASPETAETAAGTETAASAARATSAASALRPTSHPRSPSRHIPARVRRAVWERDRGQCAFVNAAGERCVERGALEFDHIRPHADGGGVELENVRLLCRQHNQHEARQFFGRWQADDAQSAAAGWP